MKKPVREYVKLRRLARACESLRNKENSILNVAVEYGFGGRETFTRAFKDTYGITPAQYRNKPVGLMNYDKPDLSLNYRMVDEGVPLIGEGLVLEYIYPAVGYSVSLITAMRRMGIRLIS